LNIAATGFVSEEAGSVASANALLLRALLARGCRMHFFSKASFVDPRSVVGGHSLFHFTDVTNACTDAIREHTQGVPLLSTGTRMLDVLRYNRMVVEAIRRENKSRRFDLCLWLGDYARGRISGIPTVSFAQGPPGTDARSVLRRFAEIRRLAGRGAAWKWKLLAHLRLSRFGLPRFDISDLIVVGSSQSRQTLHREFRVPEGRTASLPYPIALEAFRPGPGEVAHKRKRCLWLGRIVPRKRLDLFLDGIALAMSRDANFDATIVGREGFVPGYRKLIEAFPFPGRLEWIPSVPRSGVPDLIRRHDVLIQPSEEEDFGSSVAEAQACGCPVIVGRTNGNGDYLCPSDIHLQTDDPQELAGAIGRLLQAAPMPEVSRAFAEATYDEGTVAGQFLGLLNRLVSANCEVET